MYVQYETKVEEARDKAISIINIMNRVNRMAKSINDPDSSVQCWLDLRTFYNYDTVEFECLKGTNDEGWYKKMYYIWKCWMNGHYDHLVIGDYNYADEMTYDEIDEQVRK